MNQKHLKWDSEWVSKIKTLSNQLDEAKNKQLGALLTEGTALLTEKTKIEKEIRQLKSEQKSLNLAVRNHRHAKTDYERLNNATNQTTHNGRMEAFLGKKADGSTVTGTKYQTDGWLKKAENHFKPSLGKLDNLYKVKISDTDYETTEEQVINTIARVVKALKEIDQADFEAKYNAKETDKTKQTKVKTYLAQIKAQEVIVGSDKDTQGNSKQRTYDFANTYRKFDKSTNTWTNYTAPAFDYAHFFEFISLTQNQAFLADLDADKQKNVDKNENWTIFLKGNVWKAKSTTDELGLEDFGILIDEAKTELYKTSETAKATFTSSNKGIASWLELAHSITQNSNNQTKITDAFTNSPTQKFLQDLKTWNHTDGYITDGTFTLPESLDDMENIMDEKETLKLNSASEQMAIGKQIGEKNKELKTKDTEFKEKDTEADKLIKEITTKERERLKGYNITNGFAGQNKRTARDLFRIKHLLESIRYLENDGDNTQPSSNTDENTAYSQIENILKQIMGYGDKTWLVRYFENLAFKKVGEESQMDIIQAITRIKDGKYTENGKEESVYWKLEDFNQNFEEKDKLVLLNDFETKAWNAIKIALGKQEDPEDKLETYQSKLKELDPILTETVITQAIVDDWKTQNNFKTAEKMSQEVGKVLKDKKLDAKFAELIKKEDVEITDLAILFTKKKAKDIITLIRFWEYENLEAGEKEKQKKQIWWTLEKKDPQNDKKYLESGEPTEEEIKDILYQVAIGAKTLREKKKEDETSDNPNPTPTEEKGHLAKHWWKYGLGLLGAGAIGAVAIFWKQIKGWWEPKEEEGEQNSEDNE